MPLDAILAVRVSIETKRRIAAQALILGLDSAQATRIVMEEFAAGHIKIQASQAKKGKR